MYGLDGKKGENEVKGLKKLNGKNDENELNGEIKLVGFTGEYGL